MKFVGIDVHKQTITICVVDQSRTVLERQRLACADEAGIVRYLETLGAFRAVIEATASYEWLVRLIEPFAEKVLRAHPKKLRVIAESTRKSDALDARVLAEFLALDMIPTSYRPTPRQRDHRRLVRQRDSVQRRITSVKNRMRRMMSDDNADRRDLFSQVGLASLRDFDFSPADRFAMTQMQRELAFLQSQLLEVNRELKTFAQNAPVRERQLRELLCSIPGVGFVTAEVVLAEIADIERFDSQKQVVAYAGLAPVSVNVPAGRKSCTLRRPAPNISGGFWWKPPGGWCGIRRGGGRSMSSSSGGCGRRKPSWRWPAAD